MKRLSALAVVAIAASTLALPGAAHAASPDPTSSVGLAEGWLKSQLVNGALQYSTYPGANIGSTIDAALSIKTVDPAADLSSEIAAVRTGVQTGGYADNDEYDCTQWSPDYSTCLGTFAFQQHGVYAGPTGKALAFAEAVGADPTNFGGHNLVTQAEGTVQASGRIQDDSYYGDYANVLGQAFAAAGLTAASSLKAGSAVDFLLTQQCADGSFPESFNTSNKDASCAAAPRAGSVDATALVVLELHGIAGTDTALASAGQWLAAQQKADGSWSDGAHGDNADSTGLAARALQLLDPPGAGTRPVGWVAPWVKAANWLANHQLANVGTCKSYPAADRGAIAFDDTAFANTSGGTATDQYRLAASQALPALAFVQQPAPLPVPAMLASYAPGATVTLSVQGLRLGQLGCLTGPGVQKLVTGNGGVVPVSFPAPNLAGTSSYTLAGVGVSATYSVFVAGSATLHLTKHRVHRGHSLVVTISGLAGQQSVTVRLLTSKTKVTADASGKAVARLKVARSAKLGSAQVRVMGALPTRHTTAKVRILR